MSDFYKKVWLALKKIPRGRVATYKDIAGFLGRPKAARAVGNACNKNRSAPRVPCHRVVRSDGALGGYARGIKKKIKLLKAEGVRVADNKVKDAEKIKYKFN